MSDDTVMFIVVMLVVLLTAGKPDLIDALIHNLMSACA